MNPTQRIGISIAMAVTVPAAIITAFLYLYPTEPAATPAPDTNSPPTHVPVGPTDSYFVQRGTNWYVWNGQLWQRFEERNFPDQMPHVRAYVAATESGRVTNVVPAARTNFTPEQIAEARQWAKEADAVWSRIYTPYAMDGPLTTTNAAPAFVTGTAGSSIHGATETNWTTLEIPPGAKPPTVIWTNSTTVRITESNGTLTFTTTTNVPLADWEHARAIRELGPWFHGTAQDLTNLVTQLISSGQFCQIRGHALRDGWPEGMEGMQKHLLPNASAKTCLVCGRIQFFGAMVPFQPDPTP